MLDPAVYGGVQHSNSGPGGGPLPVSRPRRPGHPTWCDLTLCDAGADPPGGHASSQVQLAVDDAQDITVRLQLHQWQGGVPMVMVTFHDPGWNGEQPEDDDLSYGLALPVDRARALGHTLMRLAQMAGLP